MFLEAGIAPRSVMELDNVDSAKKMVELGLGVAFLPHVAVSDEVRSGRLRIVGIADRVPPRRPIVAVDGVTPARRSAPRRRSSPCCASSGPELQAAASATA